MRLGLRHAMPTVDRSMTVPASVAWDVIVDLDAWPVWGPSVTRAALDEPGPLRQGSRGRVWTPVGVPVPFEITEFVDGRSWAWRVAGIPATRHEVIPTATGCTVSFGVPLWAPAYLGVMAIALPRIETAARRRL